jgi:hypothetical protein
VLIFFSCQDMTAIGVITEDGTFRNPVTVEEAEQGKSILELVEKHGKERLLLLPKEWLEYYDNRVNNNTFSNPHNALDVPVNNYIRIIEVTKDLSIWGRATDATVSCDYCPTKHKAEAYTSLDEKSILNIDFDYVVLQDGTKIVSRKNKKVHTLPSPLKGHIRFSINDHKCQINVRNKLLMTYCSVDDELDIPNTRSIHRRYGYQGTIVKHWTKEWNNYRFSDLVTNNKHISNVCCVNETNNCVGEGKIKLMFPSLFSGVDTFATVSCASGILNVRICNCSCYKEYNLIANLTYNIISLYESMEQETENSLVSLLSVLRSYDPELFIKNYSRESAVLPIPVINPGNIDGPVLEYPIGSEKYYTSPTGYYPGLKRNRLSNKDKYEYIITCYKNDHMTIPSKITYQYYNSQGESGDDKYSHLLESISLEECIKEAGYEKKQEANRDVVLQEIYDREINQNAFTSFNNSVMTGKQHLLYRYYEEEYDINIILLENREVYIPECPQPYFWTFRPKRDTVIINKTKKDSYALNYKITEKQKEEIIRSKTKMTTKGDTNYDIGCVIEQYVDMEGKRRMILERTDTGSEYVWKESIGEPLNVPHIEYVYHQLQRLENMTIDVYDSLGLPYDVPICSRRKYVVF